MNTNQGEQDALEEARRLSLILSQIRTIMGKSAKALTFDELPKELRRLLREDRKYVKKAV